VTQRLRELGHGPRGVERSDGNDHTVVAHGQVQRFGFTVAGVTDNGVGIAEAQNVPAYVDDLIDVHDVNGGVTEVGH
jgi:hypothetical protein